MRGIWLTGLAVSFAASAAAAPWQREADAGYLRGAVASENVDGLSARRYDIYGEYGLWRNWTLTAKAERIAFPDASAFDAEGYRVTLRRKIWQKRAMLVSVEAGAVYGAAIGGVTGCDEVGGELRLSAGTSGVVGGLGWFAFADVAGRVHDENCWRERLEVGFGQEITRNVFLVSQAWFERGSQRARSDKIETAVLFRVGDIDLSVAYREEFSGRFEEDGIVFAVARRF